VTDLPSPEISGGTKAATTFRKKPVDIEAHRWTVNDNDEPGSFGNDHMAEWLGSAFRYVDGPWLIFNSGLTDLWCHLGDWIARQDIDGRWDYWPISAKTFEATYEPATPSETEAPR
jgi:hypothetical protein